MGEKKKKGGEEKERYLEFFEQLEAVVPE